MIEDETRDWRSYLTVSDVEWKDPDLGKPFLKAKVNCHTTLVTFKDISLQVQFKSKSGVVLARLDQRINELLKPHESVPLRVNTLEIPEGTSSVDVVINNAVVLD